MEVQGIFHDYRKMIYRLANTIRPLATANA